MNTLQRRGLQLAATMFLLHSAAFLNAQTTPAARLAVRSGLVEVQRANTWMPISSGDLLNPGDHIRTAAGSIAAMVLPEDRVITISESSQVALGDSNSAPIVQLESGSMKV